MKKILTTLLLAASSVCHAQAGITVGTATSANCYPFGCFGDSEGTRYQQVFSAAAFSGPITINNISWYTSNRNGAGKFESASYTVSLSTTGKTVNHLDENNLDNNLGSNHQFFGNYLLSGNAQPVLTFSGKAFNYDPTQGNLLLDIRFYGLTALAPKSAFMESTFRDPYTSRAYTMSQGTMQDNSGLVTTFNLLPVPEPASYAMLMAGLGLLVVARRRQFSAHSRAI